MNADKNTDRFLLALGGFAGFGAIFFASLSAGGDDVSTALLKSAVGMIVGAFLMKILIAVAHSAFKEAAMNKNASKKPPVEGAQKTEASASPAPASSQPSAPPLPEHAAAQTTVTSTAPVAPIASATAPSAAARPRPIRPRRVAS